MKKVLNKIPTFILTTLLAFSIAACSTDDDSNGADNSGKSDLTPETAATEITDMTSLKVGSTVRYGGQECLVSKNTFTPAVNRSVSRAAEDETMTASAETDAQIAENLEYIKKYLDRSFRAEILKAETGIENYVELFPKGKRKENAAGTASLSDSYVYLSENGEKIANIGVQWKADGSFIGFFWKGLQTQEERTNKFNELSEDEIRLYDPGIINVTDIKGHKKIGITFSRYDNTTLENYGKVDYTHQKTRSEACTMANSAGEEKDCYSISKTEEDGTVTYRLHDNLQTGSVIVALDTHFIEYDYIDYEGKSLNSVNFVIRTQGDGKIGGSVKAADYKRKVQVNLYKDPINVQDEFGETKSNRNMISSDNTDYSDSVRVRKQTYNSSTSQWEDVENGTSTVDISALKDGDYCMYYSTETTEVNGITVPASVTYHAHYPKNANGSYPTKDKYAKVTCYPEYNARVDRIVYMLTEKSIQDFLNAYIADFPALPKTEDSTLKNDTYIDSDTITPRFTFSGTELKIELEDMATNFEITDDVNASGGKSGLLTDDNSYAEAILTFPAGSYTGYACIKAPSADNDAFYVKIGENYYRNYADAPIPEGYAKTSPTTTISLTAESDVTVKIRIQKDSPARKGETGMYIDYILFTKN